MSAAASRLGDEETTCNPPAKPGAEFTLQPIAAAGERGSNRFYGSYSAVSAASPTEDVIEDDGIGAELGLQFVGRMSFAHQKAS
ncbi:MAG: hypothetical protein P4L73_13885 [Caulobacteraceae bacterium]|nr:hypothetical protein [Caulobacteraceae bacterium]